MTQASSLSRRQVIIFALITASLVAGDSMLYVVLPVHWKSAGLSSLWEVGLLLSLNRLARLPLNPFAGWAYSKISTKTGAVLVFTARFVQLVKTLKDLLGLIRRNRSA